MCCDRRNWDKFVCPKCDKAFGLHFDEKQQLRKEPLQQAAPGSNDAVLLAIRAVLATEHPGLFDNVEEALKAPSVKQDLPADVWAPLEASRQAVAAETQKVQKGDAPPPPGDVADPLAQLRVLLSGNVLCSAAPNVIEASSGCRHAIGAIAAVLALRMQ